MKRIIVFSLLMASIFFYIDAHAKKQFVLYGFKIGQKSSAPIKQFGKPYKTHKFKDGFSYIAYSMKDHAVIFESDNTRPDLIWGIQLEGKSNPSSLGLNGVNLGDPISKAVSVFGKPNSITGAIDESTGKPMKGIEYYSYMKKDNFSIESTNGKVTSIKVLFNGPSAVKEASIDFKKFVKDVRGKNMDKICEYISPDFVLHKDKPGSISTSIFDVLINNKDVNDIFFNKKYGISEIKESDIAGSAMRVQTDPNMVGYVYKIKKNDREYDLVFIKSFEGWVLRYIDIKK